MRNLDWNRRLKQFRKRWQAQAQVCEVSLPSADPVSARCNRVPIWREEQEIDDQKNSDAPLCCLMVSRLEVVKLISDRFDLHSISLRGKIDRSDKEACKESLNVQTSLQLHGARDIRRGHAPKIPRVAAILHYALIAAVPIHPGDRRDLPR